MKPLSRDLIRKLQGLFNLLKTIIKYWSLFKLITQDAKFLVNFESKR